MKQQHTPGPWIFNGGEVVDSHDNTIALVNAVNQWNTTDGIVEEKMPCEANARLIAAAPELLELVKELFWYCDTGDFGFLKTYDEATKLIAKIEGDERP